MMMNVDLPLAADLLEPAAADALPDTPDPAMVLPIAIAAGLVLGLILVFLRTIPDTSTRFFLSR
jgi:uncharacterized protein involved in exopolysaccharide biosynthesis